MSTIVANLIAWVVARPWVKETALKVTLGLFVGWMLTAGGCTYLGRLSTWWGKRQMYKQGHNEGYQQGLADGMKECNKEPDDARRRWKLFAGASDPVPVGGMWFGAADPFCLDEVVIEPEPTLADAEGGE